MMMKSMHGTLLRLEKSNEEIRRDLIAMKSDTNDLRGYMIKIEGDLAELHIGVNRINKRLDLVEA